MFEFEIEGAIARITMNRAEAHNAVPITAWASLSEAVNHAASAKARVMILASAITDSFCAGADIKDLEPLADDPAARAPFRLALRNALATIEQAPMTTIAAINGGCFGGGVALAMACDIRIAGPGARFAITPARLGINYPQEDISRLVALTGPGQAARLLCSGAVIDAAEAARIGLVEQHVENLEMTVGKLARAIATNAPSSIRDLKAAIRRAAPAIVSEEADAIFDGAFGGADFREGVAAFLNRRTPRFE